VLAVRCCTVLHVSPTYGRALVLLSALVGFVLTWGVGVRDVVRLSLFGLPLAFLVGTVMIRVAPHLVAPVFVPRDEAITTLGLSSETEEGSDRDPSGFKMN